MYFLIFHSILKLAMQIDCKRSLNSCPFCSMPFTIWLAVPSTDGKIFFPPWDPSHLWPDLSNIECGSYIAVPGQNTCMILFILLEPSHGAWEQAGAAPRKMRNHMEAILEQWAHSNATVLPQWISLRWARRELGQQNHLVYLQTQEK